MGARRRWGLQTLLCALCLAPFAACGGATVDHATGDGGSGARGGVTATVEAGTGGITASTGGRAAGGAVIPDASIDIPTDSGAPGNAADGAPAPDADAPFDCTDPDPGPEPPPPSIDVIRSFAAAYCGVIARCFPNYYPSPTICEDLYACSGRSTLRIPQADSVLTACTATIQAMTDCPSRPSVPCSLYTGAAKEHESCQTAVCEPGLVCRYGDPSTCPVCERLLPRGAACAPSDTCESDYFCSATTSKCEPFRRPNESCGENVECAIGQCVNGKCQPLRGEGEPCPTGLECGTGSGCRSGVCTLLAALPGASCTSALPCLGGVCENGICAAVCVNGEVRAGYCASNTECSRDERCDPRTLRCIPRPQAGAPCSPVGNDCVPGLYCDPAARCVPLRPLGSVCNAGDQCVSNYCRRDRCAPQCACTMP
jgi:hypothetical protein